jgi:hypothetical protein
MVAMPVDLTQAQIRRAVMANRCPWCPGGLSYKMVARHVSVVHGIGPRELRDLAGLIYGASLTSPETSAKLSSARRNWIENGDGLLVLNKARQQAKGKPRQRSSTGRTQSRTARTNGSRASDQQKRRVRKVRDAGVLAARTAAEKLLGCRRGANQLVSAALGLSVVQVEQAIGRCRKKRCSVAITPDCQDQVAEVRMIGMQAATFEARRQTASDKDVEALLSVAVGVRAS